MKIALITGANRGIGYEMARQLGHKGFKVILTTRFTEKGEKAIDAILKEGIDASFVQMDVTDKISIREACKEVKAAFGRLDVLVNNAAVLSPEDNDLLNMPVSMIYQTMHTNAVGPLMVVRAFHSIMPEGSRVIMMSSGGGSITGGISTWAPVYCISKTTLNAITLQLSAALKGKGIVVNAVCPGWVRTDMGGKAAERPVSKGVETPVWLATEAPADLTGRFFRDKKEIPW